MSLIVTSGLGYGGGFPGGGFVVSSIIPAPTYIDIAFSFALAQISGPALVTANYTITPIDGGNPVTVLSAALVGGNLRLTTTEFTNGKNYVVTMPNSGYSDGNSDIFQGPFANQFTAVGVAPTVVMVRAVDGRLMEVIYSKAVVQNEASNPANYSSDGGLTISAATKITDVVYRLTTSRQNRDQVYNIAVSNVHDLAGNPIATAIPIVSSLSQPSGLGGTVVTVMGANFTGATAVKFNGASASFSVTDDGHIQATVPLGCRTGSVSVTNIDGTGVGPQFRETLDYVTRQVDTSPTGAGVHGTPLYVGDLMDLYNVEMAQAMTCAGYDFECSNDPAVPPATPDPNSFFTVWEGLTNLDTEYTPPFWSIGAQVAGAIGKVYYPTVRRCAWVRYTPKFAVTHGAYQLYCRGTKRP